MRHISAGVLELQQTTSEMNATRGLSDDNNDTFTGSQSLAQHDGYYSITEVINHLSLTLGIPGNLLSAIVWIRRHVATRDSPSAIYLAALAINDLVFLCVHVAALYVTGLSSDLPWYLVWTTAVLEALLVLSFSVVRLIAIRRPLQVCCNALVQNY